MILTAQGSLLHLAAVDKASDEWLYTEQDLSAIAPPLTAILNRYDATRAAAAAGDEMALIIGLTGYTARSWTTRQMSLRAQRQQPPEPITGQPAEPGSTQPMDDPEHRAHLGIVLPDPDVEPAPIRKPGR